MNLHKIIRAIDSGIPFLPGAAMLLVGLAILIAASVGTLWT